MEIVEKHRSECIECGQCLKVCPRYNDLGLFNRLYGYLEGNSDIDAGSLLRCLTCGLCTNACPMTTLLPALAGANTIYGAGMLELGMTFSMEQLVIDNDIFSMVKKAMAGECVLGMHGNLQYDGVTLAGLWPHQQAPLVAKAGANVFGPVCNTNTSKTSAWNLSRAVTFMVLDAGSGNGRYLGELARHYNAVGIDISITALNGSRAQLARSRRFAEHLCASISDLPFKAQAFDGILCYGVLQHLFKEERESAVEEFSHILRGGGFFFFEAFGYKDMRCGGETSIPYEKKTFARQNGIIYHYFTKEEIKVLFKKFEIIELKDVIKEKNFKGTVYRRHLIKGVFRKP